MIRLLLVVCNNEFNGTERYVVDLAKNLPGNEFEVHIATPLKGPLSEILAENNLREIVYDNGKTIYYSFEGLKNLYRIMRSNRYDIVHANAKFQPCIMGKLAGVKLNVETKHGIFYSSSQLNKLSFRRKLYEYSKQFFVDKFLATSENDKKTLIRYFKIKEQKIDVVYLGIDLEILNRKYEQFSAANTKIKDSEFIIGHIGRLTFQKAQEYLLEAFNQLSKKHDNLRLVIVGSGENKGKLIDYVRKNGLDKKVIFKGFIKNIYDEMLTFDIHVLTSRFEGTGYVNLEAMALGIPIVAADVGGINNFVRSGYDAMLTEPENSSSTVNAIERLISDRELLENIKLNAMRTIQKFSVQQMALDTVDFYKRNL